MIKSNIDYYVDSCQRSLLMMDIYRKRGNGYFEYLAKGQPPILTFDYEVMLDGRQFEKPVNYALVRIFDKREAIRDRRDGENPVSREIAERRVAESDRRDFPHERGPYTRSPAKRPIVIIDPRSGQGPGIGGSQRDSEIGMAMDHGHPVYFILFYPHPEPGQTMADVVDTEIILLEEIKRLHPNAENPSVIGNCQAGWATALIGALRSDLTGPIVLNGSPMSYWAGMSGRNPIRYKGGLCGGTWAVSFLSDMGGGTFDGAKLVEGFADLNPEYVYWAKQYNLYSNLDKEEKSYLEFEKWWNGYYYMTAAEIHFIVSNLFVGNRLESGKVELGDHEDIDLKKLREPLLIFASSGDNVTPPPQALNWITRVWESEEDIRRRKQVIVYLIHDTIGHLGIFVSGQVSKKEHNEIIGSIELIEYLSPGLYEMKIDTESLNPKNGAYDVSFEERTFSDILELDDTEEEEEFRVVSAVSEKNDALYQTYISPWIRMSMNEVTAEMRRQLHPYRLTHLFVSDLNPLLIPLRMIAPLVRENRREAAADNPNRVVEGIIAENIHAMLTCYRDNRDLYREFKFKSIFGNPWLSMLYPEAAAEEEVAETVEVVEETVATGVATGEAGKVRLALAIEDDAHWLSKMEEGGPLEGVLRIMAAVAGTNQTFDKSQLAVIRTLILSRSARTDTTEAEIRDEIQRQARILQVDQEKALAALPKLITTPENRLTAIIIARSIPSTDVLLEEEEDRLLNHIETLLEDKKTL